MKYLNHQTVLFLAAFTCATACLADAELDVMKEQIRQLKADNENLHNQLNRQQDLIEKLLGKLNRVEKNQMQQQAYPAPAVVGDENVAGEGMPQLKFKGFTDVNYRTELESPKNEEHRDEFSLGQFDLIITSQLTDNLSFFGEVVFEFEETNEAVLDLERLALTYSLSDLLHVKIGRTHTALGYWNETYHHGTWFQTTTSRPVLYGFEDEGGILPVHSVGIEIFGQKEFELLDIDYSFGLSNGRGPTTETIANISDANDDKAVTLKLTVTPGIAPNLKFGVSSYLNEIPADPTNPARNGEVEEVIIGGHLVYIGQNLEFISELAYIDHDDHTANRRFDTIGFYVQVGYRFNQLTPYYRYDHIDFGEGDPFFAPEAHDITQHTVGIRWDVFTWNALKLEYSYTDRDTFKESQTITLQSTFTF